MIDTGNVILDEVSARQTDQLDSRNCPKSPPETDSSP